MGKRLLSYRVQDLFFYRSMFVRKWGSIIYARRSYGYTWRWLIDAWRDGRPEGTNLLGYPETKESTFFHACADRQYNEAEQYVCVEGCCTVLWSNGKNIGGYGPAGCPCDDLDDPRGARLTDEKEN